MISSSSLSLRAKLLAGQTVLGPLLPLDSPMLVELCGIAGFDFIFLDTEHGALLHPSYENLMRAADATSMSTIVRVAADQPIEIGRALDAGAQGIHVPFVEHAGQAQEIVKAAHFYPVGQRGLGPVRAARYGFTSFRDYVERALEQTLVVVAIEHPAAIDQIPSIAAVPGVDVIFIAPADLSTMLGHPGDVNHPDVAGTIDRALTAAHQTGKVVGSLAWSPEHARQLASRGVQYILMVLTSVIVRGAQEWLTAARPQV